MSRVRPARRTLDSMRSLLVVLVAIAGLIAASAATAPPGHAAPVLLSQGKTDHRIVDRERWHPASSATDGDAGTRWSSAAADPQWVRVDLGASSTISQVVLQWEAAYATAFQIQTSADGSSWSSVYATTTGTGGTQTLNVTGTGRYVRCRTRSWSATPRATCR